MIPQADRIDPNAAIVIQANSVRSTLTQLDSAVRDEQIEAFVQPERWDRSASARSTAGSGWC